MSLKVIKTISTRRVTLAIGTLTIGVAFALPASGAEDYPVLDGSGYEQPCGATPGYPVLIDSGYEGYAFAPAPARDITSAGVPFSLVSVLEGSGYEARGPVGATDQETGTIRRGDTSPPAERFGAILDGSGYEVESTVATDTE